MLENLKSYDVLLASKSPRRRELLSQLDVEFRSFVLKDIDESYPDDMPPENVAEFLARKKGKAYTEYLQENDILITADTVVICDEKILGKPRSADDAINMLLRLSGKEHKVVTGVCVKSLMFEESFSSITAVRFSSLTEEEVRYYVDKYKPFDKAGAYGIQEWIGCAAVESITGSFYNVMGLPVNRLYNVLKKI